MKHKNPGAPLHFLRFGTPRSSEIKRPTINIGEELGRLEKKAVTKTYILDNDIKLIHRIFARIAQLVEQMICNHQVVGSNPIPSSRQLKEN